MFGRRIIKGNLETDLLLRELIQQQMNFAHDYLCVKVRNFIKIKINENRIDPKYTNVALITEIMYNEVIKWIIFNHITTDNEVYIRDKQEKMWLAFTNGISTAYLESSANEEMKHCMNVLDWYGEYWHGYINDTVVEILTELERIKLMNHYK